MSAPECRCAVDLPGGLPRMRRWSLVVWPAFLAACLLEAAVFAAVDPAELRWPGPGGGLAAYTVAFFVFWGITMAGSGATLWLAGSGRAVSGRSGG